MTSSSPATSFSVSSNVSNEEVSYRTPLDLEDDEHLHPPAHPASEPHTDQATTFFSLPTELRQIIFDDVLGDSAGKLLTTRPSEAKWVRKRMPLMQVNRQIRAETLPKFIRTSVFELSMGAYFSRGRMVRFFDQLLGEGKVGMLRRVRLVATERKRTVVDHVDAAAEEDHQIVDFVVGSGGRVRVECEGMVTDSWGREIKSVEEALKGVEGFMTKSIDGSNGRLTVRDCVRMYDEVSRKTKKRGCGCLRAGAGMECTCRK